MPCQVIFTYLDKDRRLVCKVSKISTCFYLRLLGQRGRRARRNSEGVHMSIFSSTAWVRPVGLRGWRLFDRFAESSSFVMAQHR